MQNIGTCLPPDWQGIDSFLSSVTKPYFSFQAFVVIFEHVVFILTSIMQFIIPDIPVEVKTQMQREQLLAKEAKYQHGLKKARENDYEELLHAIREQNSNSRQGHVAAAKTNWARRLSRISDGLDAHIEISNKPRRSIETTVWQVS
jgi:anoctamin-4